MEADEIGEENRNPLLPKLSFLYLFLPFCIKDTIESYQWENWVQAKFFISKESQKSIIPCYFSKFKKTDNIQSDFKSPIYHKHILISYSMVHNTATQKLHVI